MLFMRETSGFHRLPRAFRAERVVGMRIARVVVIMIMVMTVVMVMVVMMMVMVVRRL